MSTSSQNQKPDGVAAALKYVCAELGINTRIGEDGVEVDATHVAQLIQVGALPLEPSEYAPLNDLRTRHGLTGGAS